MSDNAAYVIAHARKRANRGKGPSLSYKGIKNPRIALKCAILESQGHTVTILHRSFRALVQKATSAYYEENDTFGRSTYRKKVFTSNSPLDSAGCYAWEDKKIIFVGVAEKDKIDHEARPIIELYRMIGRKALDTHIPEVYEFYSIFNRRNRPATLPVDAY